MFIRKFLIVNCIISIILIIGWRCYEDMFKCNVINDEVLFEIYIPRINLRKLVYTMDSSLNNVDYNVEILKQSNLDNNLFFLASHSGGGDASYFDSLIYLEKGDFIFISLKDKRLSFIVEEMFYIQKNGYFEVNYVSEGNSLFLITCSLKYIDKQLIVKSKMICEC